MRLDPEAIVICKWLHLIHQRLLLIYENALQIVLEASALPERKLKELAAWTAFNAEIWAVWQVSERAYKEDIEQVK